jgi:hypothetical protein
MFPEMYIWPPCARVSQNAPLCAGARHNLSTLLGGNIMGLGRSATDSPRIPGFGSRVPGRDPMSH